MRFEWTYYTRDANGFLRDERGRRASFVVNGQRVSPQFESTAAAEQFLVDNDIRGNVR